jgi:aspartyl-tRNA synthetase
MNSLTSTYRTHTLNELDVAAVGHEVTLSGWVHRMRDHGGVLFIDLRDHYGITQIVFPSELLSASDSNSASKIKVESVIQIVGQVVQRESEQVNPELKTGEIEVKVATWRELSRADSLPFQIAESEACPENLRLQYRYLELRRSELHSNILLRSAIMDECRTIMKSLGFTEFQTPILTSSSPEGARDFLVPCRLHRGKFFALPQAPQQFKQLLMIAGFDRYFQIAPCFRDEDARADRSPGEFYQCDLEMSFVEQEDVLRVGESLLIQLFTKFLNGKTLPTPFARMTFDEAMEQYGSDKPDLRNPLKLFKVTNVFKATTFKVFEKELSLGGDVFALPIPMIDLPSRKYLDDTIEYFSKISGKGIGYLYLGGEDLKGNISKFISPDEIEGLNKILNIEEPTLVFLASGVGKKILPHLGKLRIKLGEDFSLLTKDEFRFVWILEMPFFELDEKTNKIDFAHNPFSSPVGGLESLDRCDPLTIKALQYDVVCNGYELLSGAIRNHRSDVLEKALNIVGYTTEEVRQNFPALVNAFNYGVPPHGGLAIGLERVIMLLSDKTAIRDIIPFPLSQGREDLMMGAPNTPTNFQLKELGIKVVD